MLGDHPFTERVYCAIAALVTAWLITKVWRAAFSSEDEVPQLAWAPVLIWTSIPFVVWGTVNNVLEVSVAVFTSAAVFFVLRALASASLRGAAILGAAAGVMSSAALLAKNPVGLFPLLFVPLAWAFPGRPRRVSRLAIVWAAMSLAAVAIVGALLVFEPSRHFVQAFVNQQLLPAISGQREVANDRFEILRSIVYGIGKRMLTWPAVLLVALLVARRSPIVRPTRLRAAACFLGMALLASLPIMISRKQATHYLIPSTPFYAMAMASLCLDHVQRLASAMGERVRFGMTFVMRAALAVVLVLSVFLGARFGRDRARLDDIDRAGRIVPPGSTIGVCPDLATDWGLHGYFARLQRVSLDWTAGETRAFRLSGPPGRSCVPGGGCREVMAASSIVLYRCDGQ